MDQEPSATLLLRAPPGRALHDRGQVYYALKMPDEALRDLHDSLAFGARNKSAHKYLGYTYYYHKKDYESAVTHFKKAIELGNDNADAMSN